MVTAVCDCGLKKEDLKHLGELLEFFMKHKHFPGVMKLVCSCGAVYETGPTLFGDDWTFEQLSAQSAVDRKWVAKHREHGKEN